MGRTKTGGGGQQQPYGKDGRYAGGGCLVFIVFALVILLTL